MESSFPGEALLSQFLTAGGPLAFVLLILLGLSLAFSGFMFWREMKREESLEERVAAAILGAKEALEAERKSLIIKYQDALARVIDELAKHRVDFQRTYDLNTKTDLRFHEADKANLAVLTRIVTFLSILEREWFSKNVTTAR